MVVLVLLVHWRALSARALCFDDSEYLTHNPLVQHPGWHSAGRFLGEVLEPSTVHGYYQPLTMITLMLDYAAGGRPDNLRPFHRTSLFLHLLNTAAVIGLLYLLFGHPLVAALVGLLFGVHPLTVETIAWVGERKTVLAAAFSLMALLAYVRYTRSGNLVAYAVCAVMFMLALMSKPTSTPLPVCLLLLDLWPLRRLSRRAIVEKIPLFAIAVLSAWITYESQKRTAVTVLPGADQNKPILFIICHNVVFYLRKIAWPTNLSAHYPFPYPLDMSDANVRAGVIGTVVLVAVLILSLRWTRALLVGWLYFLVAISPTLGVIGFTNVVAADKFTYLPAVGLMLPVAYYLGRWWEAAGPGTAAMRRTAITASVAILAGLAGAGTRSYLAKWQDTETLFRYMVSLTPEAAAPNIQLGLELVEQGRIDEGIKHYLRAIESAPAHHGTYYNLGNALLQKKEVPEAIVWFKRALAIKPDFAEGHNNLANALLAFGDADQAIGHYREAVRLNPDYADAHYNLANVLKGRGQPDQAIEHYREALRIKPDLASAHKNLGIVLSQRGDLAGAAEHYREALRYRPDWWDAANSLAWICATSEDPRLRNPAEALRWAQQANQAAAGRSPAVLGTLAVAHAEAGRLDLALPIAQEAIQQALQAGQPKLADEIRARMAKYRPGRPFQTQPGNDNRFP